jgi:Xaa-Pro aminopeptidase
VAVGFKKEEFAERRQLLVDLLEPGAVAVFPATMHYMMTNDIPYNYRPNSDLYYLTGFSEPECLAVLKRHPQTGKAHFTFFVRPRNPMKYALFLIFCLQAPLSSRL